MRNDATVGIFTVALTMLLPLCGCDALLYGGGPHPRWPRYAMAFANDTGYGLRGVRAEWFFNTETYHSRAGNLATGAEKRDNEEMDPIPASVTVYWTTPDNVEHHLQLEVASRIKNIAWFSGTIWFKFDDDHIDFITTGNDEPWLELKHHR